MFSHLFSLQEINIDYYSEEPDIIFIHEFLKPYRERASLRVSERYGIKNE